MKNIVFVLVYFFVYLQFHIIVAYKINGDLDNNLEDIEAREPKTFLGADVPVSIGILAFLTSAIFDLLSNDNTHHSLSNNPMNTSSTINSTDNKNVFLEMHEVPLTMDLEKNSMEAINSISSPVTENKDVIEARKEVEVSPDMFKCDEKFCEVLGVDGLKSLGGCSPYICQCANGVPSLHECGVGTVYDPIEEICNWSFNVAICSGN